MSVCSCSFLTDYGCISTQSQQCYRCLQSLQVFFCLAYSTVCCCKHNFLCYKISILHAPHCHSNLVTTPSSCILLTLESLLNQNLTCQPPSSFCNIPVTLDTLKTESKPPFKAHITKNPLLHAEKNGEHSYGENLHYGGANGDYIHGEDLHG